MLESSATGATPSPLFFGDGPDDDPLRARDEWDTGEEDAAITAPPQRENVEEARQKGVSDAGAPELSMLLTNYADISYPPANIIPIKIHAGLLPGARPFRAMARHYSTPQAAFIRWKTDEHLRLGLVRQNNKSQWACAPLLVPEDQPEQFRLTLDLRQVNRQTVPST